MLTTTMLFWLVLALLMLSLPESPGPEDHLALLLRLQLLWLLLLLSVLLHLWLLMLMSLVLRLHVLWLRPMLLESTAQ